MKTKLSLASIIAGGMMVATSGSASAADLGGDCCADLEERVATLEATTARKGNRKVSLTISGWVHKGVLYWDDGIDEDVYAGIDEFHASTRIKFKGKANISADWSAGYYIEIEPNGDRTLSVSQTNDDPGTGIALRQSNMWIQSNELGRVSWGLLSPASDDLTFYSSQVSVFAAQADFYTTFSFDVGNGANTATGGDLAGSLAGVLYFEGALRQNAIRYDTPTIGGFKLSASWGEDDFWDVGVRYAQKFGDFSFKAAASYRELGGGNDISAVTPITATSANPRGFNQENLFLANAGIKHMPTGLFVHGQYASYDYENSATEADFDSEGFYIQAGIEQRWNSLGKTVLYGAYSDIEDGHIRASFAEVSNGGTSGADRYEIGLLQNIDAAAMQLYIVYSHNEFEIDGVDQKDIDQVNFGGVIKF